LMNKIQNIFSWLWKPISIKKSAFINASPNPPWAEEVRLSGAKDNFYQKTASVKNMSDYTVRYKNSKFSHQKIEVDGKSYNCCDFEDCIIVLEKGGNRP
jgi:hypothetical protein